jgi:hypothetical protein
MVSRSQVANVPGIFEEGVLKATAGSEEGASRFTRKSNGLQGTFHAGVRTIRDTPNPIVIAKLDFRIGDRLSMNPHALDRVSGVSG